VALDADGQALLDQVIGYYHQTLKESPEGLAYLEARGLAHRELVERFKLGYANRTLGLRLPLKNRAAGADVRPPSATSATSSPGVAGVNYLGRSVTTILAGWKRGTISSMKLVSEPFADCH
jgi:hypothetical protein